MLQQRDDIKASWAQLRHKPVLVAQQRKWAHWKSVRKWLMTGVGMTKPIFSASPPAMDWNAMPTHCPTSLNTGPPVRAGLKGRVIHI